MTWKIQFKGRAVSALSKLDKTAQIKINNYLDKLKQQQNPRLQGKALTGQYAGTWRYRVGDYRIICRIQDTEITILVLDLGHRKNIY